jgi:hypothetical protein
MPLTDLPLDGGSEPEPISAQIAIDRHNNVFLLDRGSIFSPWLLPYNYENRNGLPAAAFRQSPAKGDRWGCSVRVDDGVYVFSSGGYVYAQGYRRAWWQRNGPRLFGLFLISIGIAIAVYRFFRARAGHPLLAIFAVIPGFLFGGTLYVMNQATCYVMSRAFSRRNPAMISLQTRLLDSYREQGVISEETYQRVRSGMFRDKAAADDKTESRE